MSRKKSKITSLEDARQLMAEATREWAPDAENPGSASGTAPLESTDAAAQAPSNDIGPLTFVADPYGLSLDEIANAQAIDTIDINDDAEAGEEEEIEDEEFDEERSEISISALRTREDSEQEDEEKSESIYMTEEELAALEAADESEDEWVEASADESEEDEEENAEESHESVDENESESMDEPELDLTQSLSLDALDSVAAAIAVEEEKEAEAAAERLAQQKVEDEARLAAEIAEDEALAAELARQDAEGSEQDPELLAALPSLPVADESGVLDLREVESCIEALLFMTDKPMSEKRLRELLGPDFGDEIFAQAIASLQERYQSPAHGIELAQVSGGWQLRTKPGRAALARKLAKVQTQRLSGGGMETLAIVAYKQPVLKDEIDTIRGVDSSHFIRGLLDKKLIQITGRSELPGRPMLYATTPDFLELFSLQSLEALPSLKELEQMVPASQTKDPSEEDPRVREMRKLVGQMKADNSTSLIYDPREDEKLLQEIKDKVQEIPTSTPYLDEQKAQEKAAKDAAKAAALAAEAAGQDPAQLAAEAAMAAVEPGATPAMI
jgi:segregation and condensation protein B